MAKGSTSAKSKKSGWKGITLKKPPGRPVSHGSLDSQSASTLSSVPSDTTVPDHEDHTRRSSSSTSTLPVKDSQERVDETRERERETVPTTIDPVDPIDKSQEDTLSETTDPQAKVETLDMASPVTPPADSKETAAIEIEAKEEVPITAAFDQAAEKETLETHEHGDDEEPVQLEAIVDKENEEAACDPVEANDDEDGVDDMSVGDTSTEDSQSTSHVMEASMGENTKINTTDSGIFMTKAVAVPRELHPSNDASMMDEPDYDRLGAILPVMEASARKVMETEVSQEDHDRANHSLEFEHSIEDPIDLDMFRDNVIAIQAVDAKNIPGNPLGPREQEEADEPVRQGMRYLFDNKFMKAKATFQVKATIDPLYALGLGAMAFIKAIMTYHENDVKVAMDALATAYMVAKSQIKNTAVKKPLKDSFTQYFSSMLNTQRTGPPANSPAARRDPSNYLANGLLRAHVVKAECCLLMGILQMTQESTMGYVKCGLNLRRAYSSYSLVWREYQRMGPEYTKFMDRDTVSAIQFGIGAVHLIASSMPAKMHKMGASLGWQSDKELGFALLKLSLDSGGIRAPLSSLTLLAYYSILTSFVPQLYTKDMVGPAIECLADAQKKHPNSCFFLFFAARMARVTRNLPLSTQSFTFACESSRGEWAEAAMKQMTDYEIGFNLALQLDWDGAATYFEQLSRERYWSPALCKYLVGACREMAGQRTEGILAFAEVPQLVKEHQDGRGQTYIDDFVEKKVASYQRSGYQDMDFSLPGLELLLVMNTLGSMESDALTTSLETVQRTLEAIYERERLEYTIRRRELVPRATPPDYYDQRAVLLLIKATLLNALGRHRESIAHLNWILDHKGDIKSETWVIPFAYWESGVTSWGLGNPKKSRRLWQSALACTKYDFEYRLAVRLSLALSKCDDAGIVYVAPTTVKGPTTHGRKRMPIVKSFA